MSRKKRKIRAIPMQTASKLTENRYIQLVFPEMVDEAVYGKPFASPEDRETCHWANKDEILERWLSHPLHGCSRPSCFYQYETLPGRRIIGKQKWHNTKEWEISPVIEGEHEYLFRLGLLQDFEMDRYQELKNHSDEVRERMISCGIFIPVNGVEEVAVEDVLEYEQI
jgi:hypothetical protein